MSQHAKRPATYEDLVALPDNVIGEILDGELVAHPRLALRHASAATALGEELGPPFKRGRGGPGGWILLYEPELHLGRDILVPDLGGWRRERMPELPDEPFASLAPDWVCAVLSPSTRSTDRTVKLRLYARHLVPHVWFVDPDAHTLEVLRLDGETYRVVATHADAERVRAEPFAAIELDLAVLWAR